MKRYFAIFILLIIFYLFYVAKGAELGAIFIVPFILGLFIVLLMLGGMYVIDTFIKKHVSNSVARILKIILFFLGIFPLVMFVALLINSNHITQGQSENSSSYANFVFPPRTDLPKPEEK